MNRYCCAGPIYGTPTPVPVAGEEFELMTLSSAVKVLEVGYSPEAHSIAKGGH